MACWTCAKHERPVLLIHCNEVDGLSINYGWAWRDTPANSFNFAPGEWITALAFDWIVHNELWPE